MKADIKHTRPILRSYLSRIDATERNFRRHVIEEEDASAYMGGRRVVAKIEIDTDGTITCDAEQYAPTGDEQKAIKAEIAAAPFPKSINARKGQLPPQLTGVDPKHYFIFQNQHNADDVLFIQWRRNDPKRDLPFSFWSDGEWRMMVPEGLLPLWGLEQLKSFATVFLHEGAKGARDVKSMVDEGGAALAAHPWAENLKGAAHLGWPGGATNSHLVDWSPIKKLPPHVCVIVVADNDQPGIDAVSKISSILCRSLLVIRFDDRFPTGFDLADQWPERKDWWRENGQYVGPSFDDCISSATWATQTIKTGAKGRPTYNIRKEFAAEWHWMAEPLFVHRDRTDKLLSETMFNHDVRPFSDTDDTARLIIRKLSSKVNGIIYDPSKQGGVLIVDGMRVVNTYRQPTVKAVSGDSKPFLDYMTHLIPDEDDRKEILRWCATLIARSDIKILYGLLLISQTQGVGKSTLGESILSPIIGPWNVSVPNEKEIVDSAFNSWIAHKRLAIIHEIYAGHSSTAYDRLKSVITDTTIRVNKKFTPEYEIDVLLHVFACSNSLRALKLDDTDRRWFVPRVTEETKPTEYWHTFHRWLDDGGLGIIRGWADEFLTMNEPVRRGEHAPTSKMKEDLIAEGRSEGAQMAYDLGVLAKEKKEKIVMAVNDVRDWVASQRQLDRNDSKMESALTLRKALRASGLHEPLLIEGRQQRFQYNQTHPKSHIVANFSIDQKTDWPAIKEFYKKPDEVKPDEVM